MKLEAQWIVGFVDGEGNFNCSFRKRKDYSMPWKISLCFNVSQKDKVILTLFKRHLKSECHRVIFVDAYVKTTFTINKANNPLCF